MTHSTKILRNKQADFATKPILWAYFERGVFLSFRLAIRT